ARRCSRGGSVSCPRTLLREPRHCAATGCSATATSDFVHNAGPAALSPRPRRLPAPPGPQQHGDPRGNAMDLAFLPTLPPAVSQLMLFGVLLLCGLAAGEALRRYASLPRITGYVLAGVLLGPQATGLLDSDALFEARLIVDLAIGLVVFELGSRLDFGWLKRNQWLFAAALAEALFCFVGIHV